MQHPGDIESQMLRHEIENVKNCITQYVGFTLGGSGLAFVALPLFTQFIINSGEQNRLNVTRDLILITGFALMWIVFLITIVLFYKFNSHNRYCGYLMMLSSTHRYQIFLRKSKLHPQNDNWFIWERYLSFIREINNWKKFAEDSRKGINKTFDYETVNIDINDGAFIRGFDALINPTMIFRRACLGFWIFFKSVLLARAHTLSWGFPIPITAIAFLLSSIYMLIGLTLTWADLDSIVSGNMYITESLFQLDIAFTRDNLSDSRNWISTFMVVAWLMFWFIKFSDLFRLTHTAGDRTIDSYHTRFMLVHLRRQ